MSKKQISSALISVFDKTGLAPIIHQLNSYGVTFYSTGGTEKFIRDMGYEVTAVENVTGYPSILGGRVKTLHPKVFGGILNRQEVSDDQTALEQFEIPQIDLVIVDLYPFEDTVAAGGSIKSRYWLHVWGCPQCKLVDGAPRNHQHFQCDILGPLHHEESIHRHTQKQHPLGG